MGWRRRLNPFWVNSLMGLAREGTLTAERASEQVEPPCQERLVAFDAQLQTFVSRRLKHSGGKVSGHATAFLGFLLLNFDPIHTLNLFMVSMLFIIARVGYQICFTNLMATLAADASALVFFSTLPSMALSVGLFCLTCLISSWLGYCASQ